MATMLAMPQYIVHGVDEVRPKQKGPLDVALLCSKLDAVKIHQDALQSRKRYRRTTSRGNCVLPTGPAHTEATSAAQQTRPRIRQNPSYPRGSVPNFSRNERQRRLQRPYVPLAGDDVTGAWLATDDLTGERQGEKHRSAPRQREQLSASRHENRARNERRSMEYRPGDAQKRSSAVIYSSGIEAPCLPSSLDAPPSWADGQKPRHWDDLDAGIGQQYSIPGTDRRKQANISTTRRPEYTRPNWAQDSQTGDDLHTFLKSSPRKERKVEANDGESKAPAGDSRTKDSRNERTSRGQSEQHQHRLINDAVESIKETERAKRRASLLRYFKKS